MSINMKTIAIKKFTEDSSSTGGAGDSNFLAPPLKMRVS